MAADAYPEWLKYRKGVLGRCRCWIAAQLSGAHFKGVDIGPCRVSQLNDGDKVVAGYDLLECALALEP